MNFRKKDCVPKPSLHHVTKEQKGVLRYVEVKETILHAVGKKRNGSPSFNHKAKQTVIYTAVQFEHKIYLENGHYKFVNRHTLQVQPLQKIEQVTESLQRIFHQLQLAH